MARPEKRTVLLTGASGAVGQALLERLRGHTVVCLVHRSEVRGPEVECLRGDVTRPLMGLPRAVYDDLARRADYVVHSAAETSFAAPPYATRATNVGGTERVLEFAAAAMAPLCHVSTAFAHLKWGREGRAEANSYEESKLEAEGLVRRSGLPGAIVRPSIVIGDSVSGAISKYQGFHHTLDVLAGGMLPVAPGSATARVDLIPSDTVASVIAGLVGRPDVTGDYWLTAGHEALPLPRLMSLLVENVQRLMGRRVKRPRIVEPDYVQRLVKPVFLPALPPQARSVVERSLELVKYMTIEETFPTSLPELQAKLGIPPLPNLEMAVIRNVESWARDGRAAGRTGIAVPAPP